MRHDNPDLQEGDGATSYPVFGRSLIETVDVTSAVSEVRLLLPASPFKRFQIEIDNWASVGNQVRARANFGINGATRAEPNDYSWYSRVWSSQHDTSHDKSEDATFMGMSKNDNEWAFGDGSDENFCYTVELYPGDNVSSAIRRPRMWFTGVGTSDETSRGTRNTGFGMYRGDGSSEYGRVEYIEFTFSDSSNIRSGEFRLYGTE